MDNLNPKNLTAEESIKKAEALQGTGNQEFNPYKNPEAISIIKQKDGNWKIWGQKNGKMIELRAIKPEDGIVEFLIHA